MKNKLIFLFILTLLFTAVDTMAREMLNYKGQRVTTQQRNMAEACDPPATQTDLDLNNVRARIFTASDMWWDLSTQAQYEIPKGSNRFSLFAGSIWVGGLDDAKNLRAACQTYRQGTQNDFWSGPLDSSSTISKQTCKDYDRHFVITRKEVEQFVNNKVSTPAIVNWPGSGITNSSSEMVNIGESYLAPFQDVDGDGLYNSGAGDFPKFNMGTLQQKAEELDPSRKNVKKQYLYGDKVLWWVFNDKGDRHTATDPALPIGLEIRAQAFAFESKPGDPISNMTFYQYTIANKSHNRLDSTWFGQWVDPDLGYAFDDYVGCDVQRGLGYCYNGDNFDDGALGYGENPPAVGVDFFEGPEADPNDGIDNNRNGVIDEEGEEIVMSQFVYFNNDGSPQGNPDKGSDYYNYLRGFWRDSKHMTYGGNGKGGGAGATGNKCDFMFPDNTDPKFTTPWTEVTAGNVVGDRRFIQSAGAFRLEPGKVNYITVGVVWARSNGGGNLGGLSLLKTADDQAQDLFNHNFEGLKGPDAPDLTIRELDESVILTLTNSATSNNFRESYKEVDQYLKNNPDSFYKFQGYMIFQLRDATVLGSYLDEKTLVLDPNKAKVVAQCDIQDSISQILNSFLITSDTAKSYVHTPMVYTAPDAENNFFNKGVQHTFQLNKDYFTGGKLVNNKTYYYVAIAYGFNRQETKVPSNAGTGRYLPYISGSRNAKVYQAVPHIVAGENGGTILNSKFGSGPLTKRIKGYGNGGSELDMYVDDAIFNKYLAQPPYQIDTITYLRGKGPVSIKVIDPIKVVSANYTIKFDSVANGAHWRLTNNTNGQIVVSDTTLDAPFEQVIPKWGISVTVKPVKEPLQDPNVNPVLGSSITWADSTAKWLGFVRDIDGALSLDFVTRDFMADWIKVGAAGEDYQSDPATKGSTRNPKIDPNQYFEKALSGGFAPFVLANDSTDFPGLRLIPAAQNPQTVPQLQNSLKNVGSVLLVITPDTSKWSRCPVLNAAALTRADNEKFNIKTKPSIGKDGNVDPIGDQGMSYFPGYAVNAETGERLNLMFAEDETDTTGNGMDMMWNPATFNPGRDYLVVGRALRFKWGGKHFVYIMNHGGGIPAYDKGEYLRTALLNANGSLAKKSPIFQQAMWTCMPYLKPGFAFTNKNIPPSEVRVRLSVAKPYHTGNGPNDVNSTENPHYTFTTTDLAAQTNVKEVAESAMDNIRVVPNPYYAHSQYEVSQFDNKIKITNLPQKCTINIFTVNGTLIRTITKENTGDTSLGSDVTMKNANVVNAVDWDLKNIVGVPISSGLYIFQISSPGLPDKVLKWFCVMRPLDLDSY